MSFIPALFAPLASAFAAAPLTSTLTAVGGAVQAVGAIAQAGAAASADKYNAAVEDRNAKIALQQGQAEAAEQQRENEQRLGRIRAAYGAAGISLGSDALGVYQDNAAQGALDLAKTHWNSQMRAIGYEDQSRLDKSRAKADSTAGLFGAIDAGVGAGTSILRAA
jgi:hypothetical protein